MREEVLTKLNENLSIAELGFLFSEYGKWSEKEVGRLIQDIHDLANPPSEKEKDLVLTHVGDKKIQCIKLVRSYTNRGLKEAKELVDSVQASSPEVLITDVDTTVANDAARDFKSIGSRVETR